MFTVAMGITPDRLPDLSLIQIIEHLAYYLSVEGGTGGQR